MRNYIHTRTGRILLFVIYLLLLLAVIFLYAFDKNTAPQNGNGVPKAFLYLSFDDGPSAGTPFIDSVARRDSIMINVFIIGSLVYRDDTMHRLYDLYRQNPMVSIGNHSFTHAGYKYRHYYQDAQQVTADFHKNDSLLQLHNKIARLPGRNAWYIKGRYSYDLPDAKAAADSLYDNGYRVFGWDLEWKGDTVTNGSVQSADVMMHRLERHVKDKSAFTPGNIVILCHDSLFANAQAARELGLFIRKAKQHYRFEQLSNYPHE